MTTSPEPSMNKYFKPFFAICVFVYSLFLASRPLTDPDFWFHLKTGEYILQTRTIPKTDFFSFTQFGNPWVTHEWLSEALFYAIYSRLGLNALIFIFAVLTATAFWIAFRRVAVHPFIKAFATLLSVWTVIPTIGVRPRVFTLLLTAVFLHLLSTYSRREKAYAIWWLVPLMLVWVNLHAGFIIGLVLIAVTMVGLVLDAWMAGQRLGSVYSQVKTLALVLFACLAAVVVNPHGPRIYVFPFEFLFSPVQQQLVTDWFSPDFHEFGLLPLALLIILTMAAMAISPRRPKPSEVLLFLATLYATLKSSRHMAIFALVAGPLFAQYFQSWLIATPFGKPFSKDPSFHSNRAAVLFCLLLLLPLAAFFSKLKSTAYSPASQAVLNVPVKAVAYLKENHVTGNTFTDPNIWGDYLIWALPANPVYIDGRIDMYPQGFIKEYRDITLGLSDWRGPFDRYGVRVVIVRRTSPLSWKLKEAHWQQLFEDDMAIVFAR